ncbi:MAG: serine/threonine-protein kinase [Planctomycetota bacterium]
MEDTLLNKVIGGCRIIVKIGAGGMGTVYKAHHLGLNKTVAVKILPPSFAREPERVKRFVREARAAAQLEHSGIVQILNINKAPAEQAGEPDIYFIIMQYVQGETLAQLLKAQGRMPIAEAARIIRDTAKALNVAHKKGVVHRDVKPENIMVTYDGEVKLMDFGLARVLDVASNLSQPGDILGTPHYMAPEQAQSMPVDGRADIYSLGVVYYYMVTGQRPFEGDTPISVIMQHINNQPVDPRQLSPDLPQDVCQVINKMMAKKPEDRYQKCDEVVADLDMITSSVAIPSAALAKPGSPSVVSPAEAGLQPNIVRKPLSASRQTGQAEQQPARPDITSGQSGRRLITYILGAGLAAVVLGLALAYMDKTNSKTKTPPTQPQPQPVTKTELDEKSERLKHLKATLTKRSSEFYNLIFNQNYDEAMKYFNPLIFEDFKRTRRERFSSGDMVKQWLKKVLELQSIGAEIKGVKVAGFKQGKIHFFPKDWPARPKEIGNADTQWAEVEITILVKTEQPAQLKEVPQQHLWGLDNNTWYFYPRKQEPKVDKPFGNTQDKPANRDKPDK